MASLLRGMKMKRERLLGHFRRTKRVSLSRLRSWMMKLRQVVEMVGKGCPGSMAWGVSTG